MTSRVKLNVLPLAIMKDIKNYRKVSGEIFVMVLKSVDNVMRSRCGTAPVTRYLRSLWHRWVETCCGGGDVLMFTTLYQMTTQIHNYRVSPTYIQQKMYDQIDRQILKELEK